MPPAFCQNLSAQAVWQPVVRDKRGSFRNACSGSAATRRRRAGTRAAHLVFAVGQLAKLQPIADRRPGAAQHSSLP